MELAWSEFVFLVISGKPALHKHVKTCEKELDNGSVHVIPYSEILVIHLQMYGVVGHF